MTITTPSHQRIALSLIDVSPGRRVLDPNWVSALADDMDERGQRTPIEVIALGERFRLVAGGHRKAARELSGHADIDALVRSPSEFASEAEIKLAEIVENFMRRGLSVLDRAYDVAAWRDVFEGVQGAVKPGRKAKAAPTDDELDEISRKFATNFTEAAQRALGLSRDGIFRALKIAKIDPSIRQRISLMPIADTQSELLALVAEMPVRWSAIVDRLEAGAANVADAIAILDNLPVEMPRAGWERVSDRFSRLPVTEQARFFELHKDAFMGWLAGVKA